MPKMVEAAGFIQQNATYLHYLAGGWQSAEYEHLTDVTPHTTINVRLQYHATLKTFIARELSILKTDSNRRRARQ